MSQKNIKYDVCLRTACFWVFLRGDFCQAYTAKEVLNEIRKLDGYKNTPSNEFSEPFTLRSVEKILAKAAKDNHLYELSDRRASKMPDGTSYFLKLYSFSKPK